MSGYIEDGRRSYSPLRTNNQYEQSSPGNTRQMHFQLSDLNQQMDEVEFKCRELSAAARRKELMEDTQKQLTYMQLVNRNDYLRNKEAYEAQQQLPALDHTQPLRGLGSPESPSPSKNQYYTMGLSGGPLETEMEHASPPKSPSKQTFGATYDNNSSPEDRAVNCGSVLSGLGSRKQKRRKELKSELKQEVNQLRDTIQQFEQERAILQDDAYLAMLNDKENEDRIQPSPTKEDSPSLPFYEQNDNSEIYTSPINKAPVSQFGNSYFASSPEKSAYVENTDKSAAANYAETIKFIRQQRQHENDQNLQVKQNRKACIQTEIGGEYGRQNIYDFYINKPSKTQMTTYKQHDEFAAVNFFDKVSKYDLDRGHLNYKGLWKEKQDRRHINAQNKREEIDRKVYIERYNDVVYKIDRIKHENYVIQQKNDARKVTAIEQQNELSRYISEANDSKRDTRPLQYVSEKQTTSFRRNSPKKNLNQSSISGGQDNSRSNMFNQSSMYMQRTIPEEEDE